MLLQEKIREWQQIIVDNYCRKCSDTCCNSQKHRILLDYYSLSLFEEKGIPIIGIKQLNESSLNNWKKTLDSKLFLKNGSEVQKPSIIQVNKIQFALYTWALYANFCPFYNKGEGCIVHEDPRRPLVCREYPIVFLESDDPKGNVLDVLLIKKTCEYFNREEIKSSFTKKFPVRII